MAIKNITVGTKAIARVGRNAIEVEVIALEDGGAYRVRNRNGKEFTARRLEPMQVTTNLKKTTSNEVIFSNARFSKLTLNENCHERGNFSEAEISVSAESAQEIFILPTAFIESEISESDETPNSAPEFGKPETTAKHLSLMNAAVEILRRCEQPLNTREIVAQAIAAGLWTQTRAKTPEQTLYGAIFREIATKEQPRIVKADQKGKFRLA